MLPLRALTLLALVAVPFSGTAMAEGEPTGAVTTDPTQVRPGRYRLDPAHGKITWSLSHLGFSTYYGQITDVAAEAVLDPQEPARSRISARIGTASVSGLHEKLDEHLKKPEFFDVAAFPQATYVSTSVEPTSPTTARIQGELTIKGITRIVAVDATFNQAGPHPVDRTYTVGFDGRAVIRRADFGVSAFLPALGDEVHLRLEGEFKAVE